MARREDAGPAPKDSLFVRAQRGDRAAYDELKATGGTKIVEGWSEMILLVRLQDRAGGPDNLIARGSVACEIAKAEAGLADPRDGPIERMIVRRAALCSVEANLADREHVGAIVGVQSTAVVEAMDRRRDRAHRRLLGTLKVLADVRRTNRVAVQVVVGDGNVVAMKA